MEKKALRVRSTWSGDSEVQWPRRVKIAVRASGGPSTMCFWQGSQTFVKIKLKIAELMQFASRILALTRDRVLGASTGKCCKQFEGC